MTSNAFAEQAQQARDLRAQLTNLERGDEQEMIFQEWSPGRKMVRLWSMVDGMEISIPKYMVGPALLKVKTDGKPAFTAFQAEAPPFREGDVRCFLAEDSPERESGLLEQAGLDHLAACPAIHLRSNYSKRIHAVNRHRQSWEALQDYLGMQEREQAQEQQRQQTDAMLRLAAGVPQAVQTPIVATERLTYGSDSTITLGDVTVSRGPVEGTPRRGRPPMTEEQKAAARERLAKGRATALANRAARKGAPDG